MKLLITLDEAEIRVMAIGLGFMEGHFTRESEEYMKQLLKDAELTEFCESKNEFLVIVRQLLKKYREAIVRGP